MRRRIWIAALILLTGCAGGGALGAGPGGPSPRTEIPGQPGEAPASDGDRSCRVVTAVLGGFTGFLAGGFAGGRIEQALYEGEDAGLTFAFIGGVAGAIVGARLAPRACRDASPEDGAVAARRG